jgi:predicted SAM-dependent methyltransferase
MIHKQHTLYSIDPQKGTACMKKYLRQIFRYMGLELLKKKKQVDDTDLYKKLYGNDSVKNRRFYNVSAGAYKGFGGGIYHPCWTNIDVDRPWKKDFFFPDAREYNPEIDIAHDLLSKVPIPVESDSAELIHSRFTVDRLTDAAAQFFFDEAFRILKKKGIFRIVSTNLDLDLRAYLNNDRDFFSWLSKDISIEQAFLFHVVSQVSTLYHEPTTEKISDQQLQQLFKTMSYEDALDVCTSKCSVEVHKKNRYDHFNWWNIKKFNKMLGAAGFTKVYVSAPEQSAAPVLRNNYYFDNEHIKVMMYMEGVKS